MFWNHPWLPLCGALQLHLQAWPGEPRPPLRCLCPAGALVAHLSAATGPERALASSPSSAPPVPAHSGIVAARHRAIWRTAERGGESARARAHVALCSAGQWHLPAPLGPGLRRMSRDLSSSGAAHRALGLSDALTGQL